MAQVATFQCVFCRGRGIDPFGLLSELSVCQVCGGRREVNMLLPYETCPVCCGSGNQHDTRLVCTICNGKGVISPQKRALWLSTMQILERV